MVDVKNGWALGDRAPVHEPWEHGDVVVARDVADGRPWLAFPMYVVADGDDVLVTYLPEGAPIGYLPDSDHPWYPRAAWEGSGVLMLRRRGDPYSVIHFWRGPRQEFSCWYVNLEATYRRTPIGFDYADEELDIVVAPDGSWSFKDWDLLDRHVANGRFSPSHAARIREEGERIGRDLDAGTQWWDDRWVGWRPDPQWPVPKLPPGWEDVPVG